MINFYKLIILSSMDQLHEVKVGKGMMLMLMVIFSINAAVSKSIQFVFVVGQTQVIDVVIVALQCMNEALQKLSSIKLSNHLDFTVNKYILAERNPSSIAFLAFHWFPKAVWDFRVHLPFPLLSMCHPQWNLTSQSQARWTQKQPLCVFFRI